MTLSLYDSMVSRPSYLRPNDDEATTHEVHEGGEGAVVNQPQGAVTKVVSGHKTLLRPTLWVG